MDDSTVPSNLPAETNEAGSDSATPSKFPAENHEAAVAWLADRKNYVSTHEKTRKVARLAGATKDWTDIHDIISAVTQTKKTEVIAYVRRACEEKFGKEFETGKHLNYEQRSEVATIARNVMIQKIDVDWVDGLQDWLEDAIKVFVPRGIYQWRKSLLAANSKQKTPDVDTPRKQSKKKASPGNNNNFDDGSNANSSSPDSTSKRKSNELLSPLPIKFRRTTQQPKHPAVSEFRSIMNQYILVVDDKLRQFPISLCSIVKRQDFALFNNAIRINHLHWVYFKEVLQTLCTDIDLKNYKVSWTDGIIESQEDFILAIGVEATKLSQSGLGAEIQLKFERL